MNVGLMAGRSREVVEMLERRRVDIGWVQEVRYKGQEHVFLIWTRDVSSGGMGERNAVVEWEFFSEELVGEVSKIMCINDRILKIKMVWGREMAHTFSVFAPQQGRPEEEKQQFREQLADEVSELPAGDVLINTRRYECTCGLKKG